MPLVFFRLVLLIPVFFISVVSITGLLLFSPIIWVMTLFARRMPSQFFAATAAVIRYETRAAAYAVMVTDEYPGRLFGDAENSEPELRLVLSGEAKRLLIVILVVGAFASSLGAAKLVIVIAGDPGEAALSRLEAASVVFRRSVSRCPDGPERFRCLEQAEGTWSGAWNRYVGDIGNGYLSRYFPSPQKWKAMRAIDAASPVVFALLDSSRAKTESAHLVAYGKVLKLIRHFDAVLRRWRVGAPSPHLLVGGG
jgi:hypothetical protein